MTCAEIMSKNPICCRVADSALSVAEMMKSEDIGSMPVISSDSERQVVGIVTDRDLALRLIAEGRAPEATAISDIMTSNPVICHAGDDIRDAMESMSGQQVRRIPVIDEEGRLCGIIAQADIARHLDERQAGEVLEDISQPGHNVVGRAFHKARQAVQPSRGTGTGWMMAVGIGAALGAGVMAAVDQRRLRTGSPASDVVPAGQLRGADEDISEL